MTVPVRPISACMGLSAQIQHSVPPPPLRHNNQLARFLIIAILVLGGGSQTGTQQEYKTENIERQARSPQVDGQPILDGDVLSGHLGNTVSAITGFVQSAPDEGAPATERTKVRIIFTADPLGRRPKPIALGKRRIVELRTIVVGPALQNMPMHSPEEHP